MGNEGSKVSICIPAYNNAVSVERLLLSIEKQSYKDYEVIITDDSDGDEIKELVQGRAYVKYYKNAERLGATANWNAAIAKSSGEYVKVMHHDDWFTGEDSLKAYVEMLEGHPEAGLAFSGSHQAEEGLAFVGSHQAEEGLVFSGGNQAETGLAFSGGHHAEEGVASSGNCLAETGGGYDRCISDEDVGLIRQDYRNLFLGNTVGAPSAVIVRRSALEKAGGIVYDEKLTWLVDMEYYMHILKENPHFVYTTEPLVSIGVGKGQMTERCRDDRGLNAFEYGYIYQKYQLGEEKECREKLVRILAEAGKGEEEVAAYGIGGQEYRAEKRRKMVSKIKWKLTHMLNMRTLLVLLLMVFAVSMIPILYLSGVNHATGDDFGYGKLTHEAWITTHSLMEVAKAGVRTVREFYYGWQGTWFTIFLFSLQPEVFSPKAYIIVVYLMMALWLGSTGLLTHCLLVKKCGFSEKYWGILYLLFVMAGIQFVPNTRSGIFWYNGNAHYTVPYAIGLLGIYFYFRFIDEKAGQGIGFYIGLNICMALLGGSNYQAALLVPVIIILSAAFQWKDVMKRKKILAFLLPLILEMIGLVISMESPGNRVRGGEDFGFRVSAAIGTILSCFARGMVQTYRYMAEHPLLIFIFVFAAVVLWYMPRGAGERMRYPFPAVFAGLSYCVYCASFAPEIYANVGVSGGVYNMNYFMFLYMVFSDLVYVEGALKYRKKGKKPSKKSLLAAAMAAMVFLFVFRSDAKRTTTSYCLEYIRSGQAADFKQQMEQHLSVLLDDSIKDVVLPMLNDNQGPLMHMPITDVPDAYTNTVVKDFYGKDSVVGVPYGVWIELQ